MWSTGALPLTSHSPNCATWLMVETTHYVQVTIFSLSQHALQHHEPAPTLSSGCLDSIVM